MKEHKVLVIIFTLAVVLTFVSYKLSYAKFTSSAKNIHNMFTAAKIFPIRSVVINEVFYRVDPKHGLDSLKDRKVPGKGSCLPDNEGKSDVVISSDVATQTPSPTVSPTPTSTQLSPTPPATLSLTPTLTLTPSVSSTNAPLVSIIPAFTDSDLGPGVSLQKDANFEDCPDDKRIGDSVNDEWVELYNPTKKAISLKNWSLTDDSNKATIIHTNTFIQPQSFVLLSDEASTWRFWNLQKGTVIIELEKEIGDGLDNAGDHLILKDAKKQEIDRMSWGTDTSGFTPPGINPEVTLGSSTERITPGFDTDKASDWVEKKNPTPGF